MPALQCKEANATNGVHGFTIAYHMTTKKIRSANVAAIPAKGAPSVGITIAFGHPIYFSLPVIEIDFEQ